MRQLTAAGLALLGVALVGPAWADGPKDGPSEQVLDQVKSAVVHVLTFGCPDGERAASGFVWADHGVVTDLHVIAGCSTIKVGYQGVKEFAASVLRVDAAADLALLKVDGAPAVKGLEAAERAPEVGERLDVFGYPLGVPRRDTMPVSVSYATKESPRLTDGLSPEARTQLRGQGFPDLDTQVLHIDGGNLVPGHSGAALIDWQGKVLGIGSGGLANGSAGIGWAVRADYLKNLPNAATALPKLGQQAAASFAYAMPNRGAQDTVACGELSLYRTRRATLGEIAGTSDDPDRIEGLASEIGGVPFEALKAEAATIWVEKRSGVAVVIPDGATLHAGDPFCTVSTANPDVSMLIRIVKLPLQYGTVAWDVEKYRLQNEFFRLIDRVTEAGIRFHNHGLAGGLHLVNGAEVLRRLGGTETADGRQVRLYRSDMAGRGAMILVAAVNRNLKPQNPEAARMAWAGSVLAVHLSSFPPVLGEMAQAAGPIGPRGYTRIGCGDVELSPLGEAALPPALEPRQSEVLRAAFGGELLPARPSVAWTAPRWGFLIYLPQGLTPVPDGDGCVVATRDPAVRYVIRVAEFAPGSGVAKGRESEAERFLARLGQLAGGRCGGRVTTQRMMVAGR